MAAGDFHKSRRHHKLSETGETTLVRVRLLSFPPCWPNLVHDGLGRSEKGPRRMMYPCTPRRGFVEFIVEKEGAELRCFGSICCIGIHHDQRIGQRIPFMQLTRHDNSRTRADHHVAMFWSYTIVRDQILEHYVKNATYLISPVRQQDSLIHP